MRSVSGPYGLTVGRLVCQQPLDLSKDYAVLNLQAFIAKDGSRIRHQGAPFKSEVCNLLYSRITDSSLLIIPSDNATPECGSTEIPRRQHCFHGISVQPQLSSWNFSTATALWLH